MKHLLIILISILLLSSPLFGQSERPETIIIPVSGIGDVTNTRKLILENTLTDELKKYFRIVPQEKYEQVLEQVFQELEYEECSEDTCIMRVQELLQVENVFNLQIIGEGKDSQLNLKWITLDEKKNETDYCEGCNTKKLNDKVRGLVEKLVGREKVEPVVVVEKKEMKVLYLDNGKYIGEVKNGEPNGQGTKTDLLGGKYVGEWKDGEKHGQGTFTWSDGDKYVGEFKDGKQHGQGTYTWTNGSKYVGEYRVGERNGKGTYTFPDGRKYVGEFKDGKRNGKGILTSPRGKYVGEWKDNIFWNATKYDENGNILYKFVNGEVILP